uniref:Retinol dehydrogenase 14b n=1 Tax=Hucho hucho TaxID=62062 RepID=A0A4W5NYJ3_9TELE
MSAAILVAAVGGGILLIVSECFPLEESDTVASGKTVIVTGANSGIGKAVAGKLNKLQGFVMKVTFQSAQWCAVQHAETVTCVHSHLVFEQKVEVLIYNAGIYQCPYTKTEEGFEMQLGFNHLGHFLLAHLVLDLLKLSSPSRVVVVSSNLYKYGSINFQRPQQVESSCNKAFCYSQSKLANLLFNRELNQRLEDEGVTGVTVNTLTPGIVRTSLGRHIYIPLHGKTSLLPGLAGLLQEPTGGLVGKCFANCEEEELMPKVMDDHAFKRLWDLSESMVGIKSQ